MKTAVLTVITQQGDTLPSNEVRADILASFQRAAIDQLVHRTIGAVKTHGVKDVVLAGGVACNSVLRTAIREWRSVELSYTQRRPREPHLLRRAFSLPQWCDAPADRWQPAEN